MPIIQLSPQELQQSLQANQDLLLLDVREPHEFAYAHLQNSQLIPLGQLARRIDELDNEKTLVVICHHGVRSQQACLFLQQSGFSKIYNLRGGIDAWSLACDPMVPRY
jgi:rhodanese-related sulfurtransferase